MKKLQGPALPVKAIGAPEVHGAEQAEPFVQRWLDMQRARVFAQLSVCESPTETVFALAMLGAVDESGPLLHLVDSADGIRHDPALGRHIAFGRAGSLFAQREVSLGGRRIVRVDFMIVSEKRLVIELDGHEFHASRGQRSADASRDIELTKRGWAPIRFIGSDIWRDADGCAAKVFDLLGFKVLRGDRLSPAEKIVERATQGTGQTELLADLLKSNDGSEPSTRRPFLPKERKPR